MNLAQLENRVKELMTGLEQSAAQHNALAGRLAEAQAMLQFMIEAAQKTEKVVEAVEAVVAAV